MIELHFVVLVHAFYIVFVPQFGDTQLLSFDFNHIDKF